MINEKAERLMRTTLSSSFRVQFILPFIFLYIQSYIFVGRSDAVVLRRHCVVSELVFGSANRRGCTPTTRNCTVCDGVSGSGRHSSRRRCIARNRVSTLSVAFIDADFPFLSAFSVSMM